MSQRLYSESEVAAIIAQAAERQRDAPPVADGPGLTLGEIEAAGREAGLEPALLRAAARDLDAASPALAAVPEGTTVAERWLDGPLPPGAWEDTVAMLRLRLGASASPVGSGPDTSQVGVDQEWTHTSVLGDRTTASVSPRGDRTRVRVVATGTGFDNPHMAGAVWGVLGALLPGVLAGALTAETAGLGNAAGLLAMVLAFALTAWLLSRSITGWLQGRQEQQQAQAHDLVEEMAQMLSAGSDRAPVDAPRLDLAHLGAEADPEAPVRSGRTRA